MVAKLQPFRQLLISLSPVPVTVSAFSAGGEPLLFADDRRATPKALRNWISMLQSAAATAAPGLAQKHRLGMLYVFPLSDQDGKALLA